MGNLVLSRLIHSVTTSVQNEIDTSNVSCHSDSQISLAWIKGVDKEFKTFIQNRVLEIRSKVRADKWFYCRSKENPADIITRVNIDSLLNDTWLKGPNFLFESINFEDDLVVDNTQNLPSFTKELRDLKLLV